MGQLWARYEQTTLRVPPKPESQTNYLGTVKTMFRKETLHSNQKI